jgi:hypothetical protein
LLDDLRLRSPDWVSSSIYVLGLHREVSSLLCPRLTSVHFVLKLLSEHSALILFEKLGNQLCV